MVESPNEYRWDFIGLSTDNKPTKTTSENVTDGSTYYEVDTSKLYVYYGSEWYEKQSTGGGNGDYVKVDLALDLEHGTVSTTKTARELIGYISEGKCFLSSVALDPDINSPVCLQLYYGVLIRDGTDYYIAAFTHSPEQVVKLDFVAPTIDDVFTASLPN